MADEEGDKKDREELGKALVKGGSEVARQSEPRAVTHQQSSEAHLGKQSGSARSASTLFKKPRGLATRRRHRNGG